MKTAMALPNGDPMVFAGDRSCMGMEDALAREEDPVATESGSALLSAAVECKGIRATSDFPRDLSGLSEEQIAHAYSAMRNSHASLARARGQLQRRSRELREARDRFLATLHGYEERLVVIGKEKAEALSMAQELHRELELFEGKQQALDRLLTDLDEAKEQAGFWSILRITELIGKMRSLLRGGPASDG